MAGLEMEYGSFRRVRGIFGMRTPSIDPQPISERSAGMRRDVMSLLSMVGLLLTLLIRILMLPEHPVRTRLAPICIVDLRKVQRQPIAVTIRSDVPDFAVWIVSEATANGEYVGPHYAFPILIAWNDGEVISGVLSDRPSYGVFSSKYTDSVMNEIRAFAAALEESKLNASGPGAAHAPLTNVRVQVGQRVWKSECVEAVLPYARHYNGRLVSERERCDYEKAWRSIVGCCSECVNRHERVKIGDLVIAAEWMKGK